MPYGKLDFVIAGVQKGGTTSLAEQISAHPNVSFCSEKEPHFFSKRQKMYHRKKPDLTTGLYILATTTTFMARRPRHILSWMNILKQHQGFTITTPT